MNIKKALTFDERKFIEKCLKRWRHGGIPPVGDEPRTLSEISAALNRSKNVVTFEVRRNGGIDLYNAKLAQEQSDSRKKTRLMGFSEKSFDDEEFKKCVGLFKKGTSIYTICEKMDMSYARVMHMLLQNYFVQDSRRLDDFIARLEVLEKKVNVLKK